jgi:hypothetical protein
MKSIFVVTIEDGVKLPFLDYLFRSVVPFQDPAADVSVFGLIDLFLARQADTNAVIIDCDRPEKGCVEDWEYLHTVR